MIGTTLDCVVRELNAVICRRLKLNPSSDKVQLSSIIEPDGSFSVQDNNVLLLKLVSIEPDPIANGSDPITYRGANPKLVESSPLYLNLKILLAAYFKPKDLKSGLNMLSMGIAYLQGKTLWNPQNTPSLPKGVQRLTFEMEGLDLHQQSHMWGAIGVKQMPAILYKLRMLTIDDHNIQEVIPVVTSVSTSTTSDQ
ncbi:MAG: DUF4255 domain-containing protein [Bacteroidota bacterium]